MKRKKQRLFIGVALLVAGIILRIFTSAGWLAYSLILLGVSLKISYIVSLHKAGIYKPGIELAASIIGLTLFITGLVLKYSSSELNAYFFIIPGIMFKLTFVILFIAKLRKQSVKA